MFSSLESEAEVQEYYAYRLPWMTRMYIIIASIKFLTIVHLVALLTYRKELRLSDYLLSVRYPDTEEGDASYLADCIVVSI